MASAGQTPLPPQSLQKLNIRGVVDLKTPEVVFAIFENYGDGGQATQPLEVFFGVMVSGRGHCTSLTASPNSWLMVGDT